MDFKDLNQPWSMPVTYLKVVLQQAASEGKPTDRLLAGSGLDMAQLLESDVSVSFNQTRQVITNASREFGPDWHLSLAKALTISSHGPLGFATVTASNLQASVDVLLRFVGIRAPFVWLSGSIENQWFVIRLYEAMELGAARKTLIELTMHSIQVLIERPLGRELRGSRITFSYPAPGYHKQLEAAFHAELVFDANNHTLRFPVEWLAEPCVLHDPAMHRYLITRCEEESRVASGVLPAEIAVRQALLAKTGEFPSLSQIAAQQHVSPRTLIRRLKQGNTSYLSILEAVRKTLAVDYLLYSDMQVANIAYRLGYQDTSNFGRAFRGWLQVSPGRYRANNRELLTN